MNVECWGGQGPLHSQERGVGLFSWLGGLLLELHVLSLSSGSTSGSASSSSSSMGALACTSASMSSSVNCALVVTSYSMWVQTSRLEEVTSMPLSLSLAASTERGCHHLLLQEWWSCSSWSSGNGSLCHLSGLSDDHHGIKHGPGEVFILKRLEKAFLYTQLPVVALEWLVYDLIHGLGLASNVG